jgi:TRAP-type C4-dicarboxylate transport system substrate-binding protein
MATRAVVQVPARRLRLLCTTLALLAGVAQAAAESVWDMPTAYPVTNYHTENAARFAADVEQASNGTLRLTLHTGASLYRANEIKRAVQGGQAQIGELLISAHANEDPLFGVDSIPFLATSFADAGRLWAAAKPALSARLARQGLELLYAVPWPPQGIFATRPIESGADLRGLKMRTYNPATARIAELAGAQAVTIQAAELAQALATGAVQANFTSGATGFDTKIWEVVPIFYDVGAWLPLNVVVANRQALDTLTTVQRDALTRAAAAAEARGWRIAEERTAFYLDTLREHGMTVAQPSASLRHELERIGRTLADEWLERAGTDGRAVLDTYGR